MKKVNSAKAVSQCGGTIPSTYNISPDFTKNVKDAADPQRQTFLSCFCRP